jgi:Ca2+-binding EF-hand superfamily protein
MKNLENKRMFDLLKPNANGCITKTTVQSVSLPGDMHERIGRIVYELIELDEELNFEEFCKAVEILEQENLNQSTKSEKFVVPDEFT